MKEVNHNQINNSSFQGKVNKNIVKSEVTKMEDVIKKYIQELIKTAEQDRAVPPYGEFSPVYVQFKNPEQSLNATDFMLKITKPPKTIEGHETIRNIEVVAYKLPFPYKSECIITSGTKDEIMEAMKQPELIEKIKETASRLSKNLDEM